MAKDIRVIIVKLADRLRNNMRTLDAMREDKRRRIAQETIDIYAPVANRIGLNKVYRELQDLCFKHLHPNRYQSAAIRPSAPRQPPRAGQQDHAGAVAKTGAGQYRGLDQGREKPVQHLSQDAGKNSCRFLKYWTSTAFASSSTTFPAVISPWAPCTPCTSPFPASSRITSPFPRAMATKVCTPRCLAPWHADRGADPHAGHNHIAEAGVASHWMYKSGDESIDKAPAAHPSVAARNPGAASRLQATPSSFSNTSGGLFPDEVYVFTPGCILVLPQGSTPGGFCLRRAHRHRPPLHCRQDQSRAGALAHAAEKNGDQVEVITTTQSQAQPGLAVVCRQRRARSHIRNYLKAWSATKPPTWASVCSNKPQALATRSLSVDADTWQAYLREFAEKGQKSSDADGNRHRRYHDGGGQPPAGAGWRSAGRRRARRPPDDSRQRRRRRAVCRLPTRFRATASPA